MQPRKPLTKDEALAIAADALRTVGLEKEATAIEQFSSIEVLIERYARGYDGDCEECAGYTVHSPDCRYLLAWKALGDPRYEANEEERATSARIAAEQKAARERAASEYAERGCKQKNHKGNRCRLLAPHEGVDHSFPFGLEEWDAALRKTYAPFVQNLAYADNPLLSMVPQGRSASFFGVDRNAPPQRMRVTEVDTERKIITVDQAPSLVVSPYVKDDSAYLFQNQLAISPSDAALRGIWSDSADADPLDAMKRAKEALEKMSQEKK